MIFKYLTSVLLLILVYSQYTYAFDPAETFEKKCSSCHTIGGGDDVGPDLKGVTKRREMAWIQKFIKGSQAVIQGGDPIGAELFAKFRNKKMPDQELTDDEIAQMLNFIESGAGAGGALKVRSALDAKPFEIQKGKLIFEGRVPLTNGGPACLSCHSAGDAGVLGGGALGPDLSHAYATYEDKGLSKVITKISFPTMVNPFLNKALTPDEAYWIKAYLYTVDKGAFETAPSDNLKKYIFLGIIGLLAALGVIDLAWKNRRKKTRRPQQK